MILDEKVRAAARAKSDLATESLQDSKAAQPLNVFDRRWTPVSPENPILKEYRKELRLLKIECKKKHWQLSACQKCMTIFYPFFPRADFHLHKPSESFRRDMDSRVIDTAIMKAFESEKIEDTFIYQALVGLAKEAGAYRVDEYGTEQIKLIRIVRGHRSHTDQGYEDIEFCENCEVEECPEYVARTKYRIETLASGIHKLINL